MPVTLKSDVVGRVAKFASIILLLYWGLFALIAPVTTWDSHVYNLGRLLIANIGGIWDNPFWTTERQVAFPWGFDAIHFVFLKLRFGYGIPSYLCYVGSLVIVWSSVRRNYGLEVGWLAVLATLALPTLVFQAVSTKNDVPIVFGSFVWYHAFSRWKETGHKRHLWFAALALGFCAGAKSIGLIVAILCCAITFVVVLRERKALISFVVAMLLAVIALGSIETYAAAIKRYGHPLGTEQFVHQHRNNDGAKGALANGIRYVMANLATGLEPWFKADPTAPRVEHATRTILKIAHLDNVGYRNDFDDRRMHFIRNGWDASSDFGVVGGLSMGMILITLCLWRPYELWWHCGVAAITMGGMISYSVAWMPWNNRFLLLPFTLLTLAAVCFVSATKNSVARVWLLSLSLYGAIVYPFASFNKRPVDLVRALVDREQLEFRERPTLLPILNAARQWRANHPHGELLLLAGSDTWVLPFLNDPGLHLRIIARPQLVSSKEKQNLNTDAALLVINRPDFSATDLPVKMVQDFPTEIASGLFEFAPASEKNQIDPAAGVFADGWTSCRFGYRLVNYDENALALEIWNPSPMRRRVALSTSIDDQKIEILPEQRLLITLKIRSNDVIDGSVSPPYIPGGEDSRMLGIRLSLAPRSQ